MPSGRDTVESAIDTRIFQNNDRLITGSKANEAFKLLSENYANLVDDIVDNATSTEVNKALSANQGKLLNDGKVDKVTGYSLTKNDLTDILKTAYDAVVNWVTTNGTNLINHLSNTSNPHNVTKSQVGLGNVDNTSDVNKPISTAQAAAIATKDDIIAATESLATTGTVTLDFDKKRASAITLSGNTTFAIGTVNRGVPKLIRITPNGFTFTFTSVFKVTGTAQAGVVNSVYFLCYDSSTVEVDITQRT